MEKEELIRILNAMPWDLSPEEQAIQKEMIKAALPELRKELCKAIADNQEGVL